MSRASRADEQALEKQGAQQSSTVATGDNADSRRRTMSPRVRVIALIAGDLICLFLFVSLGANQHGEGFNPFYSLWLAVPFVIAWFLVAPLIGAFRADIATRPAKMLLRILLAWLATWPVAMLLRWLLVDRVKVPPVAFSSFLAFAIVALLFNTCLLLLWRWLFAFTHDLRRRGM
jgi:hypothetical protein